MKELQLELTNHCNANCVMCPRESLKRDKGFIDREFAIKIIEQAKSFGVEIVKPQWYGESMLHKDYFDIIATINALHLKCIITTNGSLLNDDLSNQLLFIDVDRIAISIDSGLKDNYESIRRNLSFDKVCSNIEKLVYLRNKMKSKTKICIYAVKVDNSYKTVFGRFENIVDEIIVNDDLDNLTKSKGCLHRVNDRLVVAWNGDCYLCCHDWLGEYFIGNIKDGIEKVWNGEKRLKYLSNLKKLNICQKCLL